VDSVTRQTVLDLLPEVEQIEDPSLRGAVVDIWATAWTSSEWDQLQSCPKGIELPSTRTLVTHSRTVAEIAMGMADVLSRQNGLAIRRDDVIAIALLHDVSKLHEFTRGGDGAVKSSLGEKYQHGFLGAFWMQQAGLPENLVHAVIAHTFLSTVVPQTQEAVIVHYADFADTDSLLLDAGRTLFCKRK
jgi:putative nucleotidyltransferase with HDIG domain